MRNDICGRLVQAILLAVVCAQPFRATAGVEDCRLIDQSIELTPEVLKGLRWNGMTFGQAEFVPVTLNVRFPNVCFEANQSDNPDKCVGLTEINEAGDMGTVLRQAVEIEITGTFDVKRRDILGEYYRQSIVKTPFEAGRDRYSVSGGFLRLRDKDSVYIFVNSHFEDYSSGDKKAKHGDTYVGANLIATLAFPDGRRDVGIEMTAEVTYVKVTSPWDDIINFLTFPTLLAVPFGGKMLGDMIVDPIIEDVKEELPKVGPSTDIDTEKYDVASMNAFVEETILNFNDIYVGRLKFDDRTGFVGQNPSDTLGSYAPVDADVSLVLSKSFDVSDEESFPSRFSACLLSEGLALAKQSGVESIAVQQGDSLSEIAERTYGSEELVMEIARRNDIEQADLIYPGQSLVLPGFNDYADSSTRVVKAGDSLWSIAEELGEPSEYIGQLIELNPSVREPSLIHPMMILRMPRGDQ